MSLNGKLLKYAPAENPSSLMIDLIKCSGYAGSKSTKFLMPISYTENRRRYQGIIKIAANLKC